MGEEVVMVALVVTVGVEAERATGGGLGAAKVAAALAAAVAREVEG